MLFRSASAATVWAAICNLFLKNAEHQVVFLSTEFRRIDQGSASVLSYFARLKDCVDRLAELGAAVTDRDQVLNMCPGPPSGKPLSPAPVPKLSTARLPMQSPSAAGFVNS